MSKKEPKESLRVQNGPKNRNILRRTSTMFGPQKQRAKPQLNCKNCESCVQHYGMCENRELLFCVR